MNNEMKIKLYGEYTEAELLQLIENSKKLNWQEEYSKKFSNTEKCLIGGKIVQNINLFDEMFKFAMLRNDGWEPDWGNENQTKWGINEQNDIVSFLNYNSFRYGIAVKSREIAEEMLQIFGDRIKEIYGKQ